jgi:hypothetical protein
LWVGSCDAAIPAPERAPVRLNFALQDLPPVEVDLELDLVVARLAKPLNWPDVLEL